MSIFSAAHHHSTVDAFVEQYLLPSIEKGKLLKIKAEEYPKTPTGCAFVNLVNSRGWKIPLTIRQIILRGEPQPPSVYLGRVLKLNIEPKEFTNMLEVGKKEFSAPETDTLYVHATFPKEFLEKWQAEVRKHEANVRLSDALWNEIARHCRLFSFSQRFYNFLKLRSGALSEEDFSNLTKIPSGEAFKQHYARSKNFILKILSLRDRKSIRTFLKKHLRLSGATIEKNATFLSDCIAHTPKDVLEKVAKEFEAFRRVNPFSAAHKHPTIDDFVQHYLLPSLEKGELRTAEAVDYPKTPSECISVNLVNSRGKKIPLTIKQTIRKGEPKAPGVFLGGVLKIKIEPEEFADMLKIGKKEFHAPLTDTLHVHAVFPKEILEKWGAKIEKNVANVRIRDKLWGAISRYHGFYSLISYISNFLTLRRGDMSEKKFTTIVKLQSVEEFKRWCARRKSFILELLASRDHKSISTFLGKHLQLSSHIIDRGALILSRSIADTPDEVLEKVVQEFKELRG